MHKSNRHGTLSDSGRTALGGPAPDVAGRENAGEIRFEGKRWSRYVPTLCHLGERCQLTPSRNVTGVVDHEPCPTDGVRSRLAPDADEHGVGVQWLRRLALRGCNENFTQLAIRLDADDLSPVRTSTLGIPAMASMRYFDIEAARPGPRTRSVTRTA